MSPVIELNELFKIIDHLDTYPWEPFRPGVEIHRLYGDGIAGPTAALLHFIEDAPIPPHVHEGYEHLIVLHGTQTDAHGEIRPGTLRIHAPGTTHIGTAAAGCVVLAIYEKPVRFF